MPDTLFQAASRTRPILAVGRAGRRAPPRAVPFRPMIVAGLLALAPMASHAEPPQRHGRAHDEPAHRRPAQDDILVTGRKGQPACADRRGVIDYACLNRDLKTAAASARPAPVAPDTTARDATTPSKVGTFSYSATAQRMGGNLGRSAEPYRPPAPVFTHPAPAIPR